MLDQKPYLVRAIYDWIIDSGYTPYMQVLVDYPEVDVPQGLDDRGILVLNISPQATNQLNIGKDVVSFWARFRGQAKGVSIPVGAVLAVFAKENGEGMGFEIKDIPQPPKLSVVSSKTNKKGDELDVADDQDDAKELAIADSLETKEDEPRSPKKDRGHLRVIK